MREKGVLTLALPPFDRREIARYAGCPEAALPPLLEECLPEAEKAATGRVCWATYPIAFTDDGLDLGFAKTESRDLMRALLGCEGILLFAATVGAGMDRLVQKYRLLSPAKAQLFQAIGAERAETLCDVFCREFGRDLPLTPRFSPGYGDLPLTLQKDVFAALRPEKTLGLTLNDSMLMTPTKSVTAIVGF